MKRLFKPLRHQMSVWALLLSGCLLLTGCGASSSATTSGTRTSAVTVNADAIGSDCDELIADFTKLVSDYYTGMRLGSFAQAMSAYPSFYREKEAAWIAANSSLTTDAFMKSNHEWCQSNYGNDYRATVRVDKLFHLTESSITEMTRILNTSYGIDCTLNDCYHYSVTELLTGSKGNAENKLDWYVLYLPDGCYLYDTMYES